MKIQKLSLQLMHPKETLKDVGNAPLPPTRLERRSHQRYPDNCDESLKEGWMMIR